MDMQATYLGTIDTEKTEQGWFAHAKRRDGKEASFGPTEYAYGCLWHAEQFNAAAPDIGD